MTTENGSLKDWDDRHYQSIDDLPPEAWDAVRDASFTRKDDYKFITDCIHNGLMHEMQPADIADHLINAGFKRD